MGLAERLEDRINMKLQEIQDLEIEHQKKALEAKGHIAGLQEALKLYEVRHTCTKSTAKGERKPQLRAGSMVYKVYELLKKEGKPMHVADILKGIGQEVTRNKKTSLISSLTAYVRRYQIFEKSAPATFTLIKNEGTNITLESEPPDGFGSFDD